MTLGGLDERPEARAGMGRLPAARAEQESRPPASRGPGMQAGLVSRRNWGSEGAGRMRGAERVVTAHPDACPLLLYNAPAWGRSGCREPTVATQPTGSRAFGAGINDPHIFEA